MNLKIGQEIICISDCGIDNNRLPLVKHKKYTIRDIIYESDCVGLFLSEVVNEYKSCRHKNGVVDFSEPAYLSTRFAPLSERTAESEAFAETLVTELEREINEESELIEWLHK